MLKKIIALFLSLCIAVIAAGCAQKDPNEGLLDPAQPVTVTVWNYYNGDQQVAFEKMVGEFNATVGAEKGIVVEGVSQSNISNLADELINSVDGKAGAQAAPDLAAVYSETAYILKSKGVLAELDEYFTESELSEYIKSFISEGRLTQDGPLYMFPVIKSSEIFAANATDWQEFADASGITLGGITSIEDMVKAAEVYYNWTDSLTPDVPNDGKALYGRDSLSNYIFIGAAQLGHELFTVDANGKLTVDIDRDTFKKLWDNYYIPYINGYFGAYGKYRSDDAKVGLILSMTCSSSAVSYFPTAVTLTDDSTHDISAYIAKPLCFKDCANETYVQQGANYCVLKSTKQKEYASVAFMKWFTGSDRNTEFAVSASYSPVTVAANSPEQLSAVADTTTVKHQNILAALTVSSDIFTNHETYVSRPFVGSKEVRAYLETALTDIAAADREAIEHMLGNGVARELAVSRYVTDEYFDSWFEAVKAQVNTLVGG